MIILALYIRDLSDLNIRTIESFVEFSNDNLGYKLRALSYFTEHWYYGMSFLSNLSIVDENFIAALCENNSNRSCSNIEILEEFINDDISAKISRYEDKVNEMPLIGDNDNMISWAEDIIELTKAYKFRDKEFKMGDTWTNLDTQKDEPYSKIILEYKGDPQTKSKSNVFILCTKE